MSCEGIIAASAVNGPVSNSKNRKDKRPNDCPRPGGKGKLMACTIATVHDLIGWYLTTPADTRLDKLMKNTPIKDNGSSRDRAALRRVYKQLEKIEGARNILLEELASDTWAFNQLSFDFAESDPD